ncbi:hypothetical protein EDI_002730 [Entamoeba dispar SAW760]|uniref:Sphingomyelin synthase-like domain-containing protein n=1 Tax=Entamoeba dispar (strain ATCC PRA-260 / SAW760) TaxID=370354 RepID=B0EJA1_ENTDS|nr:uncharacterized protein EDI_002730 [Entamoeba dispar SAW760]EDR25409.1 hypothetical protein EDI_002730 [Entamoeba dispar SAW760]|eukprot:EDR25409.1 hypothetical protein EDI_002730 [Entamoeba dispar SAW760]
MSTQISIKSSLMIQPKEKTIIVEDWNGVRSCTYYFWSSVQDTFFFVKRLVLSFKHPLQALKRLFTSPIICCFVFMILCGLLNGLSISFAQEFQRQWYRSHPTIHFKEFVLDDLLFSIFSFRDLIGFADKYLGFLVVIMVFRFFLSKGRLIVLRRFVTLMGVMFLVRIICVYMTLLNDPSINYSDVTGNPLIESFLISGGIHISTVDKMFSGHTGSITLTGMFLIYYHDQYPIFHSKRLHYSLSLTFKIIVLLYVACGWCLFTIVRIHYTSDVFVGIILASTVFCLYHSYIPLAQTKNNTFNYILCWIEQDADDIPEIQFIKQEQVQDKTKLLESIELE